MTSNTNRGSAIGEVGVEPRKSGVRYIKRVFRRERRIWWSMVSNDALRSKEMAVVDLPESEERRILSKM